MMILKCDERRREEVVLTSVRNKTSLLDLVLLVDASLIFRDIKTSGIMCLRLVDMRLVFRELMQYMCRNRSNLLFACESKFGLYVHNFFK